MPQDDDFAAFWSAYPRRVARKDALKTWHQTADVRPPMDELLEALEQAKRSAQWQEAGGRYVPYPATWLRGERWTDEYEPAQTAVEPLWTRFRQAIRDQRLPDDPALHAIVASMGGLYALGERTTYALDQLRPQFDALLRAGMN